MIKCPRCEQPVDETVRTTCPICFTPLQPQAVTPPPPASDPNAHTLIGLGHRYEAPSPGSSAPSVPSATPPTLPPMPTVPPLPPQVQPQQAQPLPTIPMVPPGTAPGFAPMPPSAPPAGGIPGLPPQPSQGHYGAPVGAPPQMPQMTPPAAAPGMMGPGVRVSLTGEVIDSGMPAPALAQQQPGSYAGGSLAPPPPGRVGGPTAPRTNYPSQRRAEATTAKSGGNIATIIVVLLVLGGAVFGGYWYMMHRTNPKDQLQKVLTAQKAQDWKTVYTMISLSDEDKIKYPDAEKFEEGIKAQLDKVPNAALIKDLMGKIDYTVGEPTYNGNEATIPVTISVPVMGQKIEQKVEQKMKNEGGIWKAVLTGMPGLGGNQGGFGGRGGFGGMGGPSMR